mmetsp:Transcript_2776/g.2666  ORF Transcript_2776/g.2666 Transcript_2776/m.2666 type:complete len:504 (-) Transcript_2776:63-1574(-)
MVISDLQGSISKSSRVDAISAACETFNHNDERQHDEEIQCGADVALCKHLGFLLLQIMIVTNKESESKESDKNESIEISLPVDLCQETSVSRNELTDEIGKTCKAIEMVYRCSADSIHSSFNRVGTDLLPLLIQVIQEDLNSRTSAQLKRISDSGKSKKSLSTSRGYQSDGSITTESSTISFGYIHGKEDQAIQKYDNKDRTVTNDLCLKACTKIMGHIARVGALTEPLAYHRKVLSSLKRIIACHSMSIPTEARLNALWTIANLACNVENMVMMACHPGLIETLVKVSKCPFDDNEDSLENIIEYMEILRSRSIAVRAILNLSWAPENKIPFAEHAELVNALLSTAQHRTSSWGGRGKGVSGVLLQSRRHASGALRNLAAAPRRTKRNLCRANSCTLLDKLADIAQNDPDQAVRDRIHSTFHNLVCADTAEIYTGKDKVMTVLQEAASIGAARINYQSQDSHNMSLRTLRTLEKAIPEDYDAYKTLRPIMDSVEKALKQEIV